MTTNMPAARRRGGRRTAAVVTLSAMALTAAACRSPFGGGIAPHPGTHPHPSVPGHHPPGSTPTSMGGGMDHGMPPTTDDGDGDNDGDQDGDHGGTGAAQAPQTTTEADWADVKAALGRSGTMNGGNVYRVGLARTDLSVTTDGVTIKPGLSLGGYAAFARYGDGKTLLMGDLVVTEAEMAKVNDALIANGIDQTAMHKHLLAQTPSVWWIHIHGLGDAATLAKGVKAALDATAIPQPAPAPPAGTPTTTAAPSELDAAAIDTALGRKGTADGGLYKFTIARAEPITAEGRVLPPGLGVTTSVNFQPLGGGKAAINGDIVMTADEVQGVIKALRAGGIQIVEVHSHTLDEQPRLLYLHYWATGDAATLAQAMRAGLDATKTAPPS